MTEPRFHLAVCHAEWQVGHVNMLCLAADNGLPTHYWHGVRQVLRGTNRSVPQSDGHPRLDDHATRETPKIQARKSLTLQVAPDTNQPAMTEP